MFYKIDQMLLENTCTVYLVYVKITICQRSLIFRPDLIDRLKSGHAKDLNLVKTYLKDFHDIYQTFHHSKKNQQS